jgi:aspartate-semialdehyde dehydrogenase
MAKRSEKSHAPRQLRVALVGATGLVGSEILRVMTDRGFPVSDLVPLATPESEGQRVELGDKTYGVSPLRPDVFKGVDLVFCAATEAVGRVVAPAAAAAGAVVIDLSPAWRNDPQVPLVVPEVNKEALAGFSAKRIVANPSSVAIELAVALAPLHQAAALRRLVVSTYQAVSSAGKRAMEELGSQVSALFNQVEFEPEVFSRRIAFNCIPHVDVFLADEFTREERTLGEECRRILGAPELLVCATCVRVPVFNGHAESIVAEFEKPIEPAQACELLRQAPGVHLFEHSQNGGGETHDRYPTQQDAEGSDATLVGRVRKDPSAHNSLAMWCVADNLRKGGATNAVQIAEILARDYL